MLPPVFELSLIGVADPNVPNQERILLRPAQTVDLTEFGLLIGLRTSSGAIVPLNDSFFWFGNVVVAPPSWIVVHTGMGAYNQTKASDTGEVVHHFYWNRSLTMFSESDLLPMVVHLGAITFGQLLLPPHKRASGALK